MQTVSGEFALFAGDTITEENTNMVFHADYTANSQGTSIVRFTFFNTEDEEDAVSFYLKASTSLGVQSPSVPVQLTKSTFLKDNSLSFYEEFIHEDELFVFECLLLASKAGYINKSFYYRRVRQNSVMDLQHTDKMIFSVFSILF